MGRTESGRLRFTTPPSLEELAGLAEVELARIPEQFIRHVEGVGIMVEERADAATLRRLGIVSPWHLLGLYRGRSLLGRSFSDPARFPDTILLFRKALLLWWTKMGIDLEAAVRHVLVHEIAHHFGFTDQGIAAVENAAGAGDNPDGG